ncbi:MAG TPA: hypothetical protein VF981_11120 [Gemmatimonadaceae bacterium]
MASTSSSGPLDDPSPPFIYLPFAQWPDISVTLHARTPGDPLALIPALRRVGADARLTATSPSTLESYSSVPYLPIRVASRILTVLGLAALSLATIGLYAVIGYAVAQQRVQRLHRTSSAPACSRPERASGSPRRSCRRHLPLQP